MPARGLTGSRIRERRLEQGLKQAELAKRVGISPAYLNLIEHNARRIGGKLLTQLAEELGVDVPVLAEGAGAAVVGAIRDAASGFPQVPAETDRSEEFAGRFPGWADLVMAQQSQLRRLEHMVDALSERMAHDPHLATTLHDLLSTVTAINSTASILVDTQQIEDEWRDRFHRNIHEDSQRLAENSRVLVQYLERAEGTEDGTGLPQEELERWLTQLDFHISGLERALPVSTEFLLSEATPVVTAAGRALAQRYLKRYRADADAMPLAAFQAAAEQAGYDPTALAAAFRVDIASVLRRIASLPTPKGRAPIGIVMCDSSGTLTFRKPLQGFALPRFSAACAIWPLYQALARPATPMREVVEVAGRLPETFVTYAIAQPIGTTGFDAPPVFEATMLIIPQDRAPLPGDPVRLIGTSCRVCPRTACIARREPSILAQAT